ncbi:MAG: hypothetical protein WCD89_09370 [Anaerocolumna sp.]
MKIAVYTRMAEPDIYTSYLGNSIHIAVSRDDIHYRALNQNYGILFAKAVIAGDNTIRPQGVKNSFIYRTEEGIFSIFATRVNADGSEDEESKGKVLLWTSSDLIHFSEEQMVDLQKYEKIVSEYIRIGAALIPELKKSFYEGYCGECSFVKCFTARLNLIY